MENDFHFFFYEYLENTERMYGNQNKEQNHWKKRLFTNRWIP